MCSIRLRVMAQIQTLGSFVFHNNKVAYLQETVLPPFSTWVYLTVNTHIPFITSTKIGQDVYLLMLPPRHRLTS